MMKMLDRLQDRARQRFGFCGSLIIHLLVFLLISFSGGLISRQRASDFAEVMFYDGTGGGGGGGGGSEDGIGTGDPDAKDATWEEAEAEAAAHAAEAEEPQDAIVEDTASKEKPKEEQKPKPKSKPVGEKPGEGQNRGKGSGTGTGGGHGSGHGTGVGSGTGPGSGSGSGGGHGSGHGTGIGSGIGPGNGIYMQPAVPPKIVQTVPPYYPPAQKEAGIEGLSVLRLVIGTGGQVEHAELVKSSGSEALDNSALNAAKRWRFSPAKDKAGHKVRCYFNLPIRFSIKYG